jgi:hypothetical protein
MVGHAYFRLRPDLLDRRKAGRSAERSIPERMANAERKKEAPRLGRELLRGTKYEE